MLARLRQRSTSLTVAVHRDDNSAKPTLREGRRGSAIDHEFRSPLAVLSRRGSSSGKEGGQHEESNGVKPTLRDRLTPRSSGKWHRATPTTPKPQATPGPRADAQPRGTAPPPLQFPDMTAVLPERVTKRWYNWTHKTWKNSELIVKIMPEKFSEGAMRQAHHMLICHTDGRLEKFVAKKSKRGENDNPTMHDSTVIMQAACQHIAQAFNASRPPRRVQFVDCFALQRRDGSCWAVEPFIPGHYVKHNNNYGFVSSGARNTPQAFSHFSYEFSEGRMMVVDIQGVGDVYTDPQIHTLDGKGYGAGNLGKEGMAKFLVRNHCCNSICSYLQLPHLSGVPMQVQLNGTFADDSATCPPRKGMQVSDFIGELHPSKGSCRAEDLALLGLSAQQFNALVDEFVKHDVTQTGRLTQDGLIKLFHKAEAAIGVEAEEACRDFFGRAQTLLDGLGSLDFRTFVLCWTDNC